MNGLQKGTNGPTLRCDVSRAVRIWRYDTEQPYDILRYIAIVKAPGYILSFF